MTADQIDAFKAGAGFLPDWLHGWSQVVLGAIAILVAVALIAQLVHLLGDANRPDDMMFVVYLMGAIFIVPLILIIMSL